LGNDDSYKKYVAELVGTYILVFTGCGSAVIAGGQIGYTGVSFAFGFSVLVMVYALGGISGCHMNPAVSIAMLIAGKIKPRDTIIYIIAQCVGAAIGAATLYMIILGNPNYSLASNGLGQNGYGSASPAKFSMISCFFAELILTFIFLLVIFGSTSEKAPKGFAGIAIGLSLTLIHLVGIPVTNTSVNPARSLGPAIIVGSTALDQLWLFWAAPIIGAILAAVVWRLLDLTRNSPRCT
jgi:aquaporin Z